MGFWDKVKSIGKSIGKAIVPKSVQRVGDKVWGGIKKVGDKVHGAVKFGQNLLEKAEKLGAKVGKLPVIGGLAKQLYEKTPLKDLHKKVKGGLDTAERISRNVKDGNIMELAREIPQVREAEKMVKDAISLPAYFDKDKKRPPVEELD